MVAFISFSICSLVFKFLVWLKSLALLWRHIVVKSFFFFLFLNRNYFYFSWIAESSKFDRLFDKFIAELFYYGFFSSSPPLSEFSSTLLESRLLLSLSALHVIKLIHFRRVSYYSRDKILAWAIESSAFFYLRPS